MKRKLLSALLCLGLCLSLLPAALAAETTFTDVPAGSWYDKAVTTCAEKGIMVGTGEGIFSPNLELTAVECLTLAVRLYDLQRGGDGTLQKAPEDWGKYTLTLADGTSFLRYGEQNRFFSYGYSDPGNPGGVYVATVLAPGDTTEERMAWAKAHEGSATFTAEGKSYSGRAVADSGGYYGPELRFSSEEMPNTWDLVSDSKPGPERWYRDAVYTVEQLGLREADGFHALLNSISSDHPDTFRADRDDFARALAVAAGELEKKYEVTHIPDVERTEYNEGIYSLYEAGILNGQDSFGTFWGDKDLTRAECATMVARVLDPDQRLTSPPTVPNGYEQAVIDLRTGFTYLEVSEKTYETDHCTVFVYDRGGAPSSPLGNVTLIYKPGSALEAGTRINCPIPNVLTGVHRDPPEVMALSEDRKTFTYSYYYDDRVHTCVVDLATGETAESDSPTTYENQFAFVTQAVGYTIEQQLETDECTVFLRWKPLSWWDDTRDYELWVLRKDAAGTRHRLLLPSTTLTEFKHTPTDRAPDRLSLSPDGKTLTYTYHFSNALEHYGEVLHDVGDYTYTADLTTGEVTANVNILSQLNVSYWNILDSLKTETGYLVDNFSIDYNSPTTPLLRYKVCEGDQTKRDYELYLIYRAASPQLYRLPLPSTELLPDGSAPTTREPDSLTFNDDYTTLTYTYRFTEPLWNGDTLLHDKGTYIYTVDIPTAKQSVELVDAYEKALEEAIIVGGTWQVDERLETPLCTILVQHSEGGEGLYPGAYITLVFKDGSPNGVGEVVSLPTKTGRSYYGHIPPHSVSLNEEKTVFTYTYQFDEDQYAVDKTLYRHPTYKAGTYTTTVDLLAGTVDEVFTPNA